MDEKAYWISPEGDMFPVPQSHISEVISNPERFKLTRGYLEVVYKKHKEPLGWEGKAREEVIKGLIAKGWIRTRDYGDYLSVQTFSVYDSASRLVSFFKSAAGRYSPEMEVRLGILSEGRTKTMEMADMEELLMGGLENHHDSCTYLKGL
ncbi:MAG: hypothetical protein ABSC19_01975 [Syntrophorhabdales bacterium]|jgi:hypothetical protein